MCIDEISIDVYPDGHRKRRRERRLCSRARVGVKCLDIRILQHTPRAVLYQESTTDFIRSPMSPAGSSTSSTRSTSPIVYEVVDDLSTSSRGRKRKAKKTKHGDFLLDVIFGPRPNRSKSPKSIKKEVRFVETLHIPPPPLAPCGPLTPPYSPPPRRHSSGYTRPLFPSPPVPPLAQRFSRNYARRLSSSTTNAYSRPLASGQPSSTPIVVDVRPPRSSSEEVFISERQGIRVSSAPIASELRPTTSADHGSTPIIVDANPPRGNTVTAVDAQPPRSSAPIIVDAQPPRGSTPIAVDVCPPRSSTSKIVDARPPPPSVEDAIVSERQSIPVPSTPLTPDSRYMPSQHASSTPVTIEAQAPRNLSPVPAESSSKRMTSAAKTAYATPNNGGFRSSTPVVVDARPSRSTSEEAVVTQRPSARPTASRTTAGSRLTASDHRSYSPVVESYSRRSSSKEAAVSTRPSAHRTSSPAYEAILAHERRLKRAHREQKLAEREAEKLAQEELIERAERAAKYDTDNNATATKPPSKRKGSSPVVVDVRPPRSSSSESTGSRRSGILRTSSPDKAREVARAKGLGREGRVDKVMMFEAEGWADPETIALARRVAEHNAEIAARPAVPLPKRRRADADIDNSDRRRAAEDAARSARLLRRLSGSEGNSRKRKDSKVRSVVYYTDGSYGYE